MPADSDSNPRNDWLSAGLGAQVILPDEAFDVTPAAAPEGDLIVPRKGGKWIWRPARWLGDWAGR